MTMGKLGDWAKDQSPYIKLEDGESFIGIYRGYKESNYKGTPLIEYSIGEKKISSGSAKLAKRMDNVPEGTKIKIIRFGEGYDTNYEIEILEAAPTSEAWDK
jgi:hypothetical protein